MENNAVENVMTTVSSIIGVIPDPRKGNHLKHAAHDMLFASVVAVMCGYDSYRLFSAFVGVNLGWLRAHGCAFANGVPPHDAFYWLFRRLDPSLLSACLRSVADAMRKKAKFEIVAIDGRSAFCRMCKCANVQTVKPSFQYQYQLCLRQHLYWCSLLKNARFHTCTFAHFEDRDAMGCQKKIAAKIFVEKKAHYILALKDNQRTMHEEMLLLFESELKTRPGLFRSATEETRKAHGRIERRTCYQTDYVGWFQDKNEWVGYDLNVQMCKCASDQTQFPVSVSPLPSMALILVLTTENCPLPHLHISTFEKAKRASSRCTGRLT